MKEQVVETARPIINWLTDKGLDCALNILGALVIFVLGALAIRLLAKVLKKTLDGRIGKREMLVKFSVSVVVKAAWAVLMIIVLGRLGLDIGPLIAGLGVTGFIIGFAFQESLGSLAAGMMIAFNEPFKVGDFVSVAGFEGVIRHLDMMAVMLTTPDNRRITIPNKQAWGTPIVNFSAMELRRVDVKIEVAYGSDARKACQLAVAELAKVPGVLSDPEPTAAIASFEDCGVALSCRMWVRNADYWNVFFAANRQLKEAFDRDGFDIPFPQLDVHLVKES